MVKSLQAEVEKQEALIKKNENLIAKYKDYKFLDGTWHFRYDNAMRNVHFEETYQIVDGTFQAKAGTRTESVYQIAYFFHDSVRQKLFLVLKYIPETTEANFIHRLNSQPEQFEARSEKEFVTYHRARYEPVIIQDLRVESSGILKGTENIEALISYSRIS